MCSPVWMLSSDLAQYQPGISKVGACCHIRGVGSARCSPHSFDVIDRRRRARLGQQKSGERNQTGEDARGGTKIHAGTKGRKGQANTDSRKVSGPWQEEWLIAFYETQELHIAVDRGFMRFL
jgi:hypothetical protein